MKVVVDPKVGLGQVTNLDVDPKELVKIVRERAAVSQAIDPNRVVLMYEGKVLEDSRRLKELGIHEGSTLELMPKDPEGGFTPSQIFYQNVPLDFRSRVAHESKLIRASGIPMRPIDPYHWIATIKGTGRWKGKDYHISIELPDYYPFSPPKVVWETPMNPPHPNIFSTGWVCLNILDKDWRPEYTLITVYKSLQWLLEHPKHERLDRAIYSFRYFYRR